MPTNNILHFDTTVLDHMSTSMAPSLQNMRKERSPYLFHTGNVKMTTADIDTLIFTEHTWNPLSAGLRSI
jgi:hypothetical protein